jgi:hypothetical protein
MNENGTQIGMIDMIFSFLRVLCALCGLFTENPSVAPQQVQASALYRDVMGKKS